MSRIGKKLLLNAAAVTLLTGSALASVVERYGWDRLVSQSEAILRGRCLARQSLRDPQTGIIWTRYSFQAQEVFKGAAAAWWEVSEPGGVVADGGQYLPGIPQFAPGEEAVLFLYRTPAGRWRVRGLGQGHFRILTEARDGRARVEQALEGLEILPAADAGPGSLDLPGNRGTELDRFLELLRRSVRESGGRR